MNELQVFKFNNNQVRTVILNNEPYWVLKDVCDVLGISNSRMTAERLEEDEVSQTYIIDSLGRNQQTTVITESGLYAVILRSDKPNAKQFRKWVTSEVLPQIRKTGAYGVPKNFKEALLLAAKQQEEIEKLELQNKEMKPKALFAEAVSTSHTSILIGDLAKLIKQNGVDIGQKRLFEWLRQNGYLIRGGTSKNMPTQKSMDLNLFEVKESTISNPDGSIRVTKTTKVTGKGQVYFINKFLGN